MLPYLGASVIYRSHDGEDYAGIVGRLHPNGAVDVALFLAPRAVATCHGWSHAGSDPDKPPANTWRWRTMLEEFGPGGRSLFVDMTQSPTRWHQALISFGNLEQFDESYQQQRKEWIEKHWPELPPREKLAAAAPGFHQ